MEANYTMFRWVEIEADQSDDIWYAYKEQQNNCGNQIQ